MASILGFSQLGREDIDLAGGKGANLGELSRAGFAVPPGFVVTTEAYRNYVAEHGLGHRILQLVGQSDGGAQIQALFAAGVSGALAGEIAAAYRALGDDVPVAVRSSATAEDLAEASFAGQQDSFLNIRGPAALLDGVRRCGTRTRWRTGPGRGSNPPR